LLQIGQKIFQLRSVALFFQPFEQPFFAEQMGFGFPLRFNRAMAVMGKMGDLLRPGFQDDRFAAGGAEKGSFPFDLPEGIFRTPEQRKKLPGSGFGHKQALPSFRPFRKDRGPRPARAPRHGTGGGSPSVGFSPLSISGKDLSKAENRFSLAEKTGFLL